MNDVLALLLRRFSGLLVKRPALVVGLWGAPGVGKTHAVQALLRQTPCRHLSLHATAPAAQILRALPIPAKLPSWAARTVERNAAGEHIETSSLTDALAAALGNLAPFILHLEDLHEASPEQLGFVEKLAQVVSRLKGAAMVVTSREPPPEGFEALHLEPLSPAETTRLLEGEAGAVLPAEAALWIHSRAAGNPLFTLEFFRFLARQGAAWNDGQRWRWRAPERATLPVTIEALIEQTVARSMAEPIFRDAIHAKAMLGRGVDSKIWAAVAGLGPDAFNTAIAQLEREGLIASGEFAHPLYGEVIARDLTPLQRETFARRALKVFEDDPMTAAAFVEAARLEREVSLMLLERAARTANDSRNPIRAARFQASAVTCASGEQSGKLALEAARVLEKVDRPETMRLLQFAFQELPNDPEVIYLLAGYHAESGDSHEVERLLNCISASDKAQVGWIKRQISLKFASGNYKNVIERWESHPQIHDDPDPTLAYNVGFARTVLGDYSGAETIARGALEQPQLSALMNARLLTVRGLAHLYQTNWAEALAFFDQAVAHARESGSTAYTASTLHNRSIVFEQTSRETEMLADTEEALLLYTQAGMIHQYASTLSKKARILHEMGEYERSDECFQESRGILLRGDTTAFLVTCEAHISHLYLDWQPAYGAALAVKHAELALQAARSVGRNKLAIGLCQYSLAKTRQGHAQRGLELIEESLLVTREFGMQPPYQVLTAYGLALAGLGEIQSATAVFREAYQLALDSDWRVYAEKIGLELDRLTGDLESARGRLEWFEEHGLMNGANIARRLFPELADDPKASLPAAPTARLEVFGSMRLSKNGVETPVRGGKRREILAALLEARIAGRREVPRLELLDRLYPDSDEIQAGSALNDIVYQVRELCGANGVLTTETGYALGEIASDAEAFLNTGNTELWRGAYFEGVNLGRGNETVFETVHLALRAQVEALIRTNSVEASRLARLLCDADPYDLERLHLHLNALRAAKNHKSLTRAYAHALERFAEIGHVLPKTWSAFLEPERTEALSGTIA